MPKLYGDLISESVSNNFFVRLFDVILILFNVFADMDKPKFAIRDMPLRKKAKGIIIN